MGAVLASNFLVPNGTFIFELLAFLLTLAALRRWVLPYVSRVMDERQQVIRKSLEDAEEARRRHEQAEADYRKAIDEARTEARRVIDEARQAAEALRQERQSAAQAEYDQILSRAQADIDASARRAAEELRSQVGDLVVTVVERVVGEGLTADQQRGLVDRTIAEVEAEASASGAVGAR
ncbi:MAG TPA: F0F1 ATP synthase subunit B [Acidimicrobiales bacterium]|nr:F0F1 ATP synthase subunit B [Acidimicrobiales bacterium]